MRSLASRTHSCRAAASQSCHGVFFPSLSALHYGEVFMKKLCVLMAALLSLPNAANAVEWSYEGLLDHQGVWGDLSHAFTACSNGTEQSPINITTAKKVDISKLEFEYPPTESEMKNDRFTVAITPRNPLIAREGETTYRLKEMLIRSPSEHHVDGKFYMLEIQMMQEDDYNQLAYFSIFIEQGDFNPAIQQIIDHYPVANQINKTTIDWQKLLPKKRNYYAYVGSLPYPPCTQGVDVRVMKTPTQASALQVQTLVRRLGRNARLVQPVMMRTILDSGE
jgi:carbonic anhydrase